MAVSKARRALVLSWHFRRVAPIPRHEGERTRGRYWPLLVEEHDLPGA
jgi:hypothetical protein